MRLKPTSKSARPSVAAYHVMRLPYVSRLSAAELRLLRPQGEATVKEDAAIVFG